MDPAAFESVLAETRRFVREVVVPLEQEIDDTDEFPASVKQQAADMGFFGFTLPEAFGGLGLNAEEEARLVFELGWTTPAFRSLFGTNNAIAGQALLFAGTDAQKQAYLPDMAAGRCVASFALTENEAGSDAAAITTRAERDGDSYVLNGHKRYITNAPVADLFVVFARTGPRSSGGAGISVFLVERDTPGLEVGPKDKKMGQAGAWTAELFLEDVRVPVSALLGDAEGGGYKAALRSLTRGRLHIAALCVGLAERLLHESVQYAIQRVQFGRPIAEHQFIQGMLARSRMETYAARALVLDACADYDRGVRPIAKAASAKLYCSEMVDRVADRAVQIHGGAGYMRGVAVERFYRDARLFRIYEGTSEIQQIVIAREVVRAARHADSPSPTA